MEESKAYNMAVKQTLYHGIKFRSRLEARWAVIWDALGIEFQYEPERFIGCYGEEYLPDFYFPDGNIYGEVKATDDQLFESASKISGAVDFNATPISNSNGLLLLGPIPCNETKEWGYALHGEYLYWQEGVALGDFYIVPGIALEGCSDRLFKTTMWTVMSCIDISSAPDLPSMASVKNDFVDLIPYSEVHLALTFARQARFDFDDNVEKMLLEKRHIIGGSD